MIRAKTIGSLALALSLGACATTQWRHPGYRSNPALHEQRLAIDNGYCQQVVQGTAPMPQIAEAPATPTGYYVNGSSTTYGSRGISNSSYSATVTPTVNPVQSFAGGAAQGTAIRAMWDAKRAREDIHKGCMAHLGWVAQ